MSTPAENLIDWTTDGRPLSEDLRGDPCVVWDPDASLWRMYMAYDPNDELQGDIRMSTSADRVNWSASEVVMAIADEPYAAWYMHPVVVRVAVGDWRMWYCGKHLDPARQNTDPDLGSEGMFGYNRHAMRYATSTDGITWTRYPNDNYGIVYVGTSNWDPVRFRTVIWQGGLWHCYFNSNNNETDHGPGRDFGISYMTSPDGVTWTRDADVDRFNPSLLFDVCPVRWDEHDGTERWVAIISEATTNGISVTPRWKLAVYTAATIDGFDTENATFVGYIAGTEDTDTFQMEGVLPTAADRYDLYRPWIIVPDRQCNVTSEVRAGNNLWLYCYARLLLANKGNIVLFRLLHNLEAAVFSTTDYRLPVDSPVVSLGSADDANTRALWLFGESGGIDRSGNGHDLRIHCRSYSASGADMELASGDYMRRRAGTEPTTLWTTGDFTLEFQATLESTIAAGQAIYLFGFGGTSIATVHYYVYIDGKADGNHRFRFVGRSGSATVGADSDYAFTWVAGQKKRIAICRDAANNVRFFSEGVQVGATKTMVGALDTYAASIPFYIGRSVYSNIAHFDGVIHAARISGTCRYTTNYTPADLTAGYQTAGTIFTRAFDLESASGQIYPHLLNLDLPAGCSATIKQRAATSTSDVSTTIGDFAFAKSATIGRYQQLAIVLTGDGTVTPAFSGIAFERGHLGVSCGLHSLLVNASAVAALVGTRIYPLFMPQDVTLPALTYQWISGPWLGVLNAAADAVPARIQITSWAATYRGAKALAKAVRQALDNYLTLTASQIESIKIDDEGDALSYPPESEAARRYGIAQDYLIWATA